MNKFAQFAASAALALGLVTSAAAQDIAIRGDQVHTMAGDPIENGVVIVREGKITAVGPAVTTPIPDGLQVLDAAIVTPGLIDARTVVGLAGYLNQDQDQDQLEESAPMQPQLRAIDGYNPQGRLVEYLRSLGITTIHTGHGPGALVSGQTMVAKTTGNTADDAALVSQAMVAANLGPWALAQGAKSPGTRSKQIAMLRTALQQARDAQKPDPKDEKEEKDNPVSLEAQAMRDVLSGKMPLLITANRAQDIMSALRLKEEFGIDLVLDGAAEAYLLLDEVKSADISVILHPPMARQYGELENASFTSGAVLSEAGIPFAFQSGYEGYVPKTRVVLWEAAIAAANGLNWHDAMRAITVDAARIIGVADHVGSLEVGKDGDVALFSGDPLEYTTHVSGVVIDGVVVSDTKM